MASLSFARFFSKHLSIKGMRSLGHLFVQLLHLWAQWPRNCLNHSDELSSDTSWTNKTSMTWLLNQIESLSQPIHSFMLSFFHSFIHSFIHSFVHSFIRLFQFVSFHVLFGFHSFLLHSHLVLVAGSSQKKQQETLLLQLLFFTSFLTTVIFTGFHWPSFSPPPRSFLIPTGGSAEFYLNIVHSIKISLL